MNHASATNGLKPSIPTTNTTFPNTASGTSAMTQ